jgi:hypothetical protein
MNRLRACKYWFILLALTTAGSLTLSADIISTFSVDGSLTFTSSGITWTFTNAPFTADQASIGPGADGIYSGVAGTDASIQNLSTSTTSGTPFIGFDSAPGLGTLNITGFLPGFGSTAGCSLTPPAPGQTCSFSGLPVTFVNTSGHSSLVSFDLTGVTSDGTGTWEGDFTTQFNESYQTLLSTLGSGGSSPQETYSATFTVDTDPPAVPEPASIGASLVGLGLVVLRSWKTRVAK